MPENNNQQLFEKMLNGLTLTLEDVPQQLKDYFNILSNKKFNLELCSYKQQDNKDFVMIAVAYSGFNLAFASDRLKSDKEVVLLSVRKTPNSFIYANPELSNDKEVLIKVLEKDGSLFLGIPPLLREDRDIVLATVKSSPLYLEYVDYTFINDKEIVLEAIKKNNQAYFLASSEIQKLLKDNDNKIEALQALIDKEKLNSVVPSNKLSKKIKL